MQIEFEDDNSPLYEMQDAWNAIEEQGINPYTLNHYSLAEYSSYNPQEWKLFLTNPQVVDELNSEMMLMQTNAMRALVGKADADSKSTGLAQIMATLDKNIKSEASKKTGPIFIYTFVDLNKEEQEAPNVEIAQTNPFLVKDDK